MLEVIIVEKVHFRLLMITLMARFADRIDNKVLNRTVGITLILPGTVTILFKLL